MFSLPMYAKYSKVQSVKNLGYERLAIRLKKEYDKVEVHRQILDDLKSRGVEADYRYSVNYKTENTQKVE